MRLYTTSNEILYFTSTPPKPVDPGEPPDVIEPPVDPVPPQAVINAPREAEINQEVTFDGAGSQSSVEITAYQWDLGDGTKADRRHGGTRL